MSLDASSSTPDEVLINAARQQCEPFRSRPARDAVTQSSDSSRRRLRPARGEIGVRSDFLPGYELLGERHRGGQGVVYEAVQFATKRHVAIKMLHVGPDATAAAQRARFEREVEILGQLRHPNVVTIHDSGVSQDRLYFVMDLVDGQRLDEWVAAP